MRNPPCAKSLSNLIHAVKQEETEGDYTDDCHEIHAESQYLAFPVRHWNECSPTFEDESRILERLGTNPKKGRADDGEAEPRHEAEEELDLTHISPGREGDAALTV
ncbi:hypothetical protein KW790_02210 [Candidatus Parcubacteria bacterium]|nr:hypothetical protein [Candidatus Parcubacteria bacterium]